MSEQNINERNGNSQNVETKNWQKVMLTGKERLDMVGVKKVEDFDKTRIHLETVLGDFIIKGEDLHIAELLLDEEKLSVVGNISAMEFAEESSGKNGRKKNGGLLNRLTR